MTVALIYFDAEPKPKMREEFERVASELSIKYQTIAYPAHTAEQLINIAKNFEGGSVSHLIFVCHGFTTKLLHARGGVYALKPNAILPRGFIDIKTFCDTWEYKFATDLKVSLCACMCSRTPTVTLRKLLGRAFGMWDPLIHENGGVESFSGKLRDELVSRGINATVRGHTTPGHVVHNPALREHRSNIGEIGYSLFKRALDPLEVELNWKSNRCFNQMVKGELAQRWVLFDGIEEQVIVEIRMGWKK